MKHAPILITATLLLSACASHDTVSPSARLAGAGGMPTMRAAPDVTPWTSYRTFTFSASSIEISTSDMAKIHEIVVYLKANPSLNVAIDGTLPVEGTSDADRSLGNRRAASVRAVLMDTDAGVASYRIVNGTITNSPIRKVGEVQVLVGPRTGSLRAGL
jgi:outer membrane protein OmpA-like peptidoglycan-associated protein